MNFKFQFLLFMRNLKIGFFGRNEFKRVSFLLRKGWSYEVFKCSSYSFSLGGNYLIQKPPRGPGALRRFLLGNTK